MQITRFVLGSFSTNCYIVSQDKQGPCILIDPSADGEMLVEHLRTHQLEPQAVFLTHSHYDHLLGVPALQDAWPALPVYCHPLDIPKETQEWDMGQLFPTVAAFHHVTPMQDSAEYSVAGLCIQALHTPGHTPGSVVLLCENLMFSGDTLFYENIGRTDFPGGNMQQMQSSLRRLNSLTQNYRILPGHEQETTLSHEQRCNPWMLQAARA